MWILTRETLKAKRWPCIQSKVSPFLIGLDLEAEIYKVSYLLTGKEDLGGHVLTTEVFKLDITGLWTTMHLLDGCLQADINRKTSLGFVASLTSDSPFAQADEPTSHKNEKTTVTMKSCRNKDKTGKKKKKKTEVRHRNKLISLCKFLACLSNSMIP